eukprot:4587839-Amphidinium_carterae.1
MNSETRDCNDIVICLDCNREEAHLVPWELLLPYRRVHTSWRFTPLLLPLQHDCPKEFGGTCRNGGKLVERSCCQTSTAIAY